MGEHIPLEHNKELDVPESSTLFKHIQTQVYYSKSENKKLDETVLKYLQGISSKVASQKNLIVQPTWHYFFDHVLADITKHDLLQKALYNTEAKFFKEDVPYKSLSDPLVRSNLIKKYLHEILTKAIFNYSP